MYDASDTIYYLEEGHKVVAVEANPNLCERASKALAGYIKAGQLDIVNAAIGPIGATMELTLAGDDMGSSSVLQGRVASKNPVGSYSVKAISIQELFNRYGLPYYLKVDIEGCDRMCVLALTSRTRPKFLSFEIGNDMEELLDHAQSIGYRRFKVINQCNFLELANQYRLYDRVCHRLLRFMGYADPARVRRVGRFFSVGHSSGPVPWQSNGYWYSACATIERWRKLIVSAKNSAWYDIHAV